MKATTMFTKKKHVNETKNMKIDFSIVIFSDEGRWTTLDEPDGLAKDWIL